MKSRGASERERERAKPSDLPLELATNLKTAKTLGLDVPPSLLSIADEAID